MSGARRRKKRARLWGWLHRRCRTCGHALDWSRKHLLCDFDLVHAVECGELGWRDIGLPAPGFVRALPGFKVSELERQAKARMEQRSREAWMRAHDRGMGSQKLVTLTLPDSEGH